MNLPQLNDYFTGKKRRASYQDACNLYKELKAHADGDFPEKLLNERRPSETLEIFDYRKKIYQPITMEPMSSIIRSLGKIRRSPDWTIRYKKENQSPLIAGGETLQDYCEYNFPYHSSVTNWAFSILLKNILIDTNAAVFVMPLNPQAGSNEYTKPYPVIYNSDAVYEYIENELAILLSAKQTEQKGKIFYVIAEGQIQQWEQVGTSSDYSLTFEYAYSEGFFPVFRLPGIFKKYYGTGDMLTTSHIQPIVPRLNEAAREYSDMQAEVVQHIFSESWEFASQKCEECMDPISGVSTGKIKTGNGKRLITCTKCNGTGWMGTGPYKRMQLRPSKLGMETPAPIPPKGYVQKNTDIVKLQDDRIERHIYRALSAINMQFLAQAPLNVSAAAKEVDRDELNNFVYGIAEDIVAVLDTLYSIINEYRYGIVLEQPQKRKAQLPQIPVPEKFDILTGANMLDQLKGIRNAQASANIIIATEIDYCAKSFSMQPEVKDELMTIYKLDPLPGITEAEKFTRKQGGGVRQIDYVISSNIVPFVRRALDEDPQFYQKPLHEQKKKMEEYGKGVMEEVNP